MKTVSKSAWSKVTVFLAGFSSLMIFTWPLFVSAKAASEASLAQAVFIGLMPLLLLLVLIEVASGEIGSKQLALLGVLIALNAVIRLLGAGTAGVETAFFLIIIAAFKDAVYNRLVLSVPIDFIDISIPEQRSAKD